MRVDRCIVGIVVILLLVSSFLLFHGVFFLRRESRAASSATSSFSSPLSSYRNKNHHLSLHNNNNHHHHEERAQEEEDSQQQTEKKRSSYFWGLKKEEKQNPPPVGNWHQKQEKQQLEEESSAMMRCDEEYFDSLPTYDDYISAGISRKERAATRRKNSNNNNPSRKKESDSSSTSSPPSSPSDDDTSSPCDPFVAPFSSSSSFSFPSSKQEGGQGEEEERREREQEREKLIEKEKRCLELMQTPSAWESVEMIEPRFEQRTVKYVVRLAAPNSHVRLLMKVPQASFATEPFSEITTFGIDRALKINRVPPTVLVPFPLKRLHDAAHKVMHKFHMVMELGYTESNFSKWWQSEFYSYVQKHVDTPPRVMFDENLLWVSLQLRLEGVTELLESPLRVPYSKKMSGWHRWFNPRWEGFATVTGLRRPIPDGRVDTLQPGYVRHSVKPYSELLHASMMALSELAIFDFIVLNNDRSPNKNNFIIDGCFSKIQRVAPSSSSSTEKEEDEEEKKHNAGRGDLHSSSFVSSRDLPTKKPKKKKDIFCSAEQIQSRSSSSGRERAKRGNTMTFVHLDQGMSFHGFSHVNNPIAKRANSTFCLFYKPLMERIRCFLKKYPSIDEAETFLKSLVPEPALRVLGKKKVKWMIGQLSLLIQRKNSCVNEFGSDIVMQPKSFPLF